MDIAELQRNLHSHGFRESSYSLMKEVDERYCLIFDDLIGQWSLFYAEKGRRTNEHHFQSISEACFAFIRMLESSVTARSR